MRITERDLDKTVLRLNELTGSPTSYFNDERKTNIGHFCLDCAYSGVQLQRVVNHSGGVSTVFNCGYTTKRELYSLMQAFVEGYKVAKDEQ